MKDDEKKEEKSTSELNDGINAFGRVITQNKIRVMSMIIAGQIEGHTAVESPMKATKYEHVIPQLIYADENDEIDAVLIIINTVGGDVEAGLCIAEMIRGMKKPTCTLVLGGGHSIGIPLAVSAKHSFIAKSASMTVHPVRINGLFVGVVQSFEYMKKIQDRINEFIIENSEITPENLNKLMHGRSDMATDIGTILDGDGAVREGLIDEIGSYRDAMKYLEKSVNSGKK